MSERSGAGVGRLVFHLPFVIGDVVLVAAAAVIWGQGHRPMTAVEVVVFGACVGLGAWLGVWPFRLQQRAEERLAEVAGLESVAVQIGRVEEMGRRIEAATALWQRVQEEAGRAAGAAGVVAERIAAEHREFREFLERADRTEREHLRLEVDKLRRAEGDWLQTQVRMLDHVYALYVAGVRSGQERIVEQLGQFQQACREAARRVGLVVLQVPGGTKYESESMQVMEGEAAVPVGAVVVETVATGYAFQGQLVRKALVAVRSEAGAAGEVRAESFGSLPASAGEMGMPVEGGGGGADSLS